MQVRLLPPANWDGPTNMAADEVMLESAILGIPGLRFYTWSAPTVSLGYFQPASVRDRQEGLASLSYVRRATGGATLVHHHELTYAMALPPGSAWQPRGVSWICRMHEIIAAALSTWHIAGQIVGCEEEKKLSDVVCFMHHTPGDLVVRGHKVAGSAQRKSRGALLQHGGILLRRSPYTPMLPGISDLAAVDLDADQVRLAIENAFVARTKWPLEPATWAECEMQRMRQLAQEKYSAKAWNLKR